LLPKPQNPYYHLAKLFVKSMIQAKWYSICYNCLNEQSYY